MFSAGGRKTGAVRITYPAWRRGPMVEYEAVRAAVEEEERRLWHERRLNRRTCGRSGRWFAPAPLATTVGQVCRRRGCAVLAGAVGASRGGCAEGSAGYLPMW